MNKAELTTRVSTRTFKFRAGADAALSAVVSTIADGLANGETVAVSEFGTISTKSQ